MAGPCLRVPSHFCPPVSSPASQLSAIGLQLPPPCCTKPSPREGAWLSQGHTASQVACSCVVCLRTGAEGLLPSLGPCRAYLAGHRAGTDAPRLQSTPFSSGSENIKTNQPPPAPAPPLSKPAFPQTPGSCPCATATCTALCPGDCPSLPQEGVPSTFWRQSWPSLLGCLGFQDGEHRGTGPAAVGWGHILAHLLLDPI